MRVLSGVMDSEVPFYVCACALGAVVGFLCLFVQAHLSHCSYSVVDAAIYMHFGVVASIAVWWLYTEFWVGWNFPNNLFTDFIALLFVAIAPMNYLYFPLLALKPLI